MRQTRLSTSHHKYDDVYWCQLSSRTGKGTVPRESPYTIELTAEEEQRLQGIARRYTSPYRDVIRAKIILYAARGLHNDEIAAQLDTPRQIVSKWRKRFFEQRLAGLHEQPRGGRPARFSPQRDRRGQSPGL